MNITKMRMIPMIGLIGVLISTASCNNEDKTPCSDQNLAEFRLALTNQDDDMLLDEEDFETDELALFAVGDDESVEVEFEIKKLSGTVSYISSLEMSELSLNEGITEFELYLGETLIASIDFTVTSSQATGCVVFSYSAKSESDDLSTITSGNTKIYVFTLNESEDQQM